MRGQGRWFRRRRRADDDRGQLLLLAGIVLILAFVITSLSLGRLADLEKQTLAEQKNPLLTEYRLFRAAIGRTLDDVTTTTTDNSTFLELFASTAGSLRNVEQRKGFEVVVMLAADGRNVPHNETSFAHENPPNSGTYTTYVGTFASDDGTVDLQGKPYDGVNDGLIWVPVCKDGSGPCLQAALAYLYLSDGTTTIQEVVLYPLNNN